MGTGEAGKPIAGQSILQKNFKSDPIHKTLNLMMQKLKKDLALMEKDLKVANAKSEEVLVTVTEKAREAEGIKKQVQENKNKALNIVKNIEKDKVIAENALEAARPALEEAEEALNTIKPVNIATVRKLAKPPHLIMRVMDATMILFRTKFPLITMDPSVPCPKPAWAEALKVMSSVSFLSQLLHFPKAANYVKFFRWFH